MLTARCQPRHVATCTCRHGRLQVAARSGRRENGNHGNDLVSTQAPGRLAGQGIAAVAAATSILLNAGPALAFKDIVGEFTASGFLFKDTIEVAALDDPDVKGITIYISDFKRNIVDKLKKDFFTEPSQASITCAATGPVIIKDEASLMGDGREIFEERKGLNIFKDKTLRVRRLYDSERKALIYVAYRTSFTTASDEGGVSTGRYRTSACAIPVLTNQVTMEQLGAPPLTE